MSRVPLRYQATEYDCGCTAVVNAVNYVADFSSIPAVLLKVVYDICLNECNAVGELGAEGTSTEAMRYIAQWMNEDAGKAGCPISCTLLEGGQVTLRHGSPLVQALQRSCTAAVVLCNLCGDEHYVTLTDVDDEHVLLFDPYYWPRVYDDRQIVKVNDVFAANRMLPRLFMDTTQGEFYALPAVDNRLAVVFEGTA